MIADVAHVLHFDYATLMDMEPGELMRWHEQAARILKATSGAE